MMEESPDDDKSPELQGALWTCNSPLSSIFISRHTVTSLSFGSHHCLFLTDNGDVFSFGKNSFGQLGTGDTVEHTSIPFHVSNAGPKARAIACGPHHSALVTVDGLLLMWGWNGQGQCGSLLENIYAPEVVEVSEELGSCKECGSVVSIRPVLVSVACGQSHTLAVSDKYKLFAWGAGPQLGLGTAGRSLPKQIDYFSGKKVVAVACGATHSLAVTESFPEADTEDPIVICETCVTNSAICPLGLPCLDSKPTMPVGALNMDEEHNTKNELEVIISNGSKGGTIKSQCESNTATVSTGHCKEIKDLSSEKDESYGVTLASQVLTTVAERKDRTEGCTSTEVSERLRDRAETAPLVQGTCLVNEGESAAPGSNELNGVELRKPYPPLDRSRSASVPSKRVSSILDPEHAMEFLDRQLGHKSRDKNRQSVPEETISDPSRESSSSASSAVLKNVLTRVTTTVVDRLNFVAFTPQFSGASRNSSAESFELVDSDEMSKSGSDITESQCKKQKGSSSVDSRKVWSSKQEVRTQVWSWGKGTHGQLGHGDILDRMQPCLMKQLSEFGVFKVSAGHGHSLALTSKFSVLSWGLNDTFQLGHNLMSKCFSTPKLIVVSLDSL